MKKSSRYLLIGLGIVVFFVIAPLLVLYVSGTKLHLDSRIASSTGILDVKSEPSGAKVTIDGKDESSTPATIRFLAQGEYLVKITKDGYRDWVKRLAIEAGEVRFAQEGVEAVQLIKNSVPVEIESKDISNFILVGNTIWYAKGNDVIYTSATDPAEKITITNAFNAPSALMLLRDKKHILIPNGKESVLINSSSKAISVLPFSLNSVSQIQVPSDDIVIYHQGNELYAYNLIAKNTVQIKTGVRAFTMLDSTTYFAREDGDADQTGIISSAIWNGTTFLDEQTISEEVNFSSNEVSLIITDRKELFLNNSNNGFYRVGPIIEQIVSHVDKATLDPNTNELDLQISGELWFYNFLTNKPQLLTRSTNQVFSFLIRSSIGYGFAGSNTGLEVIEIDTRDQQNRYQLLTGNVYQLAITENQKTIIALQDGKLVTIELGD